MDHEEPDAPALAGQWIVGPMGTVIVRLWKKGATGARYVEIIPAGRPGATQSLIFDLDTFRQVANVLAHIERTS